MSQDPNKDPTKETTDDQKSPSNGHEDSAQTPADVPTISPPSPTDSETTAEPSTIQQPTDPNSEPLCAICLEPITDRTVAEPCLHAFCRRCIDSSLQNTNRCPTCRQRVDRILFNFRSALDYDQQDVGRQTQENANEEMARLLRIEEEMNRRDLIFYIRHNRQQPEHNAQLRQHLIENPREFVTVNVGREDEYPLPAWTFGERVTHQVILTDRRGVYLILRDEDERSEYLVRYLQPNQMHLFNRTVVHFLLRRDMMTDHPLINGFSRLVSPNQLGSAIHELVNHRVRYERQRQQRLQQQQQVQEVVEQNNRESNEPSDGQETQATGRKSDGKSK